MGRGDLGFAGLHSLETINQWIGVINANLNAATRTGYKVEKVKFRGGVTEITRTPNGPVLGIQNPEATLQIDQTSIDFSQGGIIASTEPTHLAIQGKGFFALSTTIGLAPGAGIAAASDRAYYSRDGEFHVIDAGAVNAFNFGTSMTTMGTVVSTMITSVGTARLLLVHSTGLYLTDINGDAMVLDVANGLVRIDNSTMASATIGQLPVFRETELLNTNTPNFLRFSRFGSTVFEATQDSTMVQVGVGEARVISQTLESSNSSLSQTLPELSLAQKFFSAVSKVISVHQTNLDTVINLVR